MHRTIAYYTSIISDLKKYTKGVSGMDYRNIRNITDVFGYGLVTINSTLGVHKELDLKIPKANQWIGSDINQNQLLTDMKVYKTMKN